MLNITTFPGGISAAIADVPGGTEPELLLIHGMFGGAWQFAGWQEELARLGRSSVAIDLRGHKGSPPVADIGKLSLRDYVDDALGVARELGKPVVIGHSMGGLIAQKLAEADAVSAAVLICSAPPRGISVASVQLLARQIKHAPAILFSRPLFPGRADADALFLNRVPPPDRDSLFERLVPESGRAGRELSLGAIAVDASRVRCPVISIAAGDDRFLPPRIARAIARKYDCEYREYANHAHYIVGEPGWETVVDDVAAWIAAHA
jgi:pimeloyl-ACP methyl ester carboxylesterase